MKALPLIKFLLTVEALISDWNEIGRVKELTPVKVMLLLNI